MRLCHLAEAARIFSSLEMQLQKAFAIVIKSLHYQWIQSEISLSEPDLNRQKIFEEEFWFP